MDARQESRPRGRERQRHRTRRDLVAAAAALLREGRTPTVAEVAEAAQVSRATAYRYFPSQEMLLAEVALFAVGGPLSPRDEAPDGLPPSEAVGRLVRRVAEWAYDHEQPLRMILRLSLDPGTGVRRPGHRLGWIEQALAPLRDDLDPVAYERLTAALALFLGIDPVVVMQDIARLPRERALDALEWGARTLVESALAGPGRGRPRALRASPPTGSQGGA